MSRVGEEKGAEVAESVALRQATGGMLCEPGTERRRRPGRLATHTVSLPSYVS